MGCLAATFPVLVLWHWVCSLVGYQSTPAGGRVSSVLSPSSAPHCLSSPVALQQPCSSSSVQSLHPTMSKSLSVPISVSACLSLCGWLPVLQLLTSSFKPVSAAAVETQRDVCEKSISRKTSGKRLGWKESRVGTQVEVRAKLEIKTRELLQCLQRSHQCIRPWVSHQVTECERCQQQDRRHPLQGHLLLAIETNHYQSRRHEYCQIVYILDVVTSRSATITSHFGSIYDKTIFFSLLACGVLFFWSLFLSIVWKN